jgi:hypothetical protein
MGELIAFDSRRLASETQSERPLLRWWDDVFSIVTGRKGGRGAVLWASKVVVIGDCSRSAAWTPREA